MLKRKDTRSKSANVVTFEVSHEEQNAGEEYGRTETLTQAQDADEFGSSESINLPKIASKNSNFLVLRKHHDTEIQDNELQAMIEGAKGAFAFERPQVTGQINHRLRI